MSDPVAKADFVRLHLALSRRALGIAAEIPELDDDQAEQLELEGSVARHPARPVTKWSDVGEAL
jgi:hypothetical protein